MQDFSGKIQMKSTENALVFIQLRLLFREPQRPWLLSFNQISYALRCLAFKSSEEKVVPAAPLSVPGYLGTTEYLCFMSIFSVEEDVIILKPCLQKVHAQVISDCDGKPSQLVLF